jgi:hypothetical protein
MHPKITKGSDLLRIKESGDGTKKLMGTEMDQKRQDSETN